MFVMVGFWFGVVVVLLSIIVMCVVGMLSFLVMICVSDVWMLVLRLMCLLNVRMWLLLRIVMKILGSVGM